MIYKSGRYYMAKFHWKGQLIRKSTRATDAKTARSIEGKLRVELAKGNWDILEKRPAPTLGDFLKKEFQPFTETRFATKPKSLDYYLFGVNMLTKSSLSGLRLNEITGQHGGQFAARYSHLSPSTINCGLRTLRRAMSLAVQWGKLERMPKISFAKGELQRDRVLPDQEADRYLAACRQPWRDAATLILGSGLRPGEVFKIRWEHVLLNGHGGLIQIAEGKSRAARRVLPMVPAVYAVMKARHEGQGCPSKGWVFPTGSVCGHLEQGIAKTQHSAALNALAEAHKKEPDACPEIKQFEPYCLRHTALTNLAAAGCDAFTLARIAGHNSIQITMRYCHPQADAIERAFAKMGESQEVVTDGGQQKSCLPGGRSNQLESAEDSKVLVSREGIEPPTY
jgi:integrase